MKSNVSNARARGAGRTTADGEMPSATSSDTTTADATTAREATDAGPERAADRRGGVALLRAMIGTPAPAPGARDAGLHEALVLGVVAVASVPAVWISPARPTAWAALGLLALTAVSALVPRTASATFARGSLALAAGALLAVSAPDLAPLSALWAVACVGTLTTRLPAESGWMLTAAGGGQLAVLELVLEVMAEPLGSGAGPDGILLAGAAVTLAVGMAGSAFAHRAADATAGWVHTDGGHRPADPRADGGNAGSTGNASTDPLTGLGTRATLLRGITRALARRDVIGGGVTLLVIDVDRYDTLAERLGERGGQEALRHLARRLRAATSAEDVVVRLGDSAFGVLVEGIGPDGSDALARRMSALVEEPMTVASVPTRVTCSIGTALADDSVDTPERLLRAATTALRSAQTAGRGRWARHDPAMGAYEETSDGLEADLRDAVATRSIDVVVQPLVDLGPDAGQDRTGGVEVSPRWTRPEGTTVPPQHFLAVAEDLGIDGALGDVVLDRALDLLAEWRGTERDGGAPAPRHVAVNLTRGQLEEPGFAGTVSDRMSARALEPSSLSVEISAVSYVDTEQARRTLGMLRSLGVGITVDEFGRGPLGLVTLCQLPIDTVKVDRAVTAELARDGSLLSSVLTLCRAMGRRCTVDGVETTSQLEAARRLGADGAQGFLLGRPAASATAEAPRHIG